MTQVVADDILARWHRRIHDWDERVLKGSLDPEEVAREVQKIIDRGTSFARDMRKEGWTLLEHTSRRLTSVVDLELVSFLKHDEDAIGGAEMVRRARGELDANYGQEDAEWLLECQGEIPVEFREFYIPFTATVWQVSSGYRFVPYLYWSGERWILSFGWLDYDWLSDDRLLRPRK